MEKIVLNHEIHLPGTLFLGRLFARSKDLIKIRKFRIEEWTNSGKNIKLSWTDRKGNSIETCESWFTHKQVKVEELISIASGVTYVKDKVVALSSLMVGDIFSPNRPKDIREFNVTFSVFAEIHETDLFVVCKTPKSNTPVTEMHISNITGTGSLWHGANLVTTNSINVTLCKKKWFNIGFNDYRVQPKHNTYCFVHLNGMRAGEAFFVEEGPLENLPVTLYKTK